MEITHLEPSHWFFVKASGPFQKDSLFKEDKKTVSFWNWASSNSNQQQKRWKCFENNRVWVVEKSEEFAVKTDILLEKDW